MWTASGQALIGSATHDGHPITDLAVLSLFGIPHHEGIHALYEELADLPPERT